MLKLWLKVFAVVLLMALAGLLWRKWNQGAPRRDSLATLQTFCTAVNSNQRAELLTMVAMPQAVQGRTAPEQAEFLSKALQDEISPEGLAVLRRDGQFGSLTNLFPHEAAQWASQAGVKPEDCVAFKLERNGTRAEVVLALDSPLPNPHPLFRIVRCNNVKQMAGEKISITN